MYVLLCCVPCHREAYVERKMRLTNALGPLLESVSLYAYLDAFHSQLLIALQADCIAVCEKTGVVAVYGDESVAPNPWGIRELNKLCRDDRMLAISSFSAGLNGLGAGVAYFKLSYAQTAIVRSSCIRDVRWCGKPDYNKKPDLNGMLQPRASFAAYIEQGRTESKTWTEQVSLCVTDECDAACTDYSDL